MYHFLISKLKQSSLFSVFNSLILPLVDILTYNLYDCPDSQFHFGFHITFIITDKEDIIMMPPHFLIVSLFSCTGHHYGIEKNIHQDSHNIKIDTMGEPTVDLDPKLDPDLGLDPDIG